MEPPEARGKTFGAASHKFKTLCFHRRNRTEPERNRRKPWAKRTSCDTEPAGTVAGTGHILRKPWAKSPIRHLRPSFN